VNSSFHCGNWRRTFSAMAGLMLAAPPLTNFAISGMTAAIYENPRAGQSEIAATNRVFIRRTSC
jgi:hypothetical protein